MDSPCCPTLASRAALYLIGHGLVKASLFICAGILLHRFKTVDEFELQGRGRATPVTGILLLIGAIGLAGIPPFANFFGESLIDDAAEKLHLGWLSIIFIGSAMLTSGAVLRVAGRIFLGWGDQQEPPPSEAPKIDMDHETTSAHHRVPLTMILPPAVLLLIALVIAPSLHFRTAVLAHTGRMQDSKGYAALVLTDQPLPPPGVEPPERFPAAWRQAITLAGALIVAWLSLFPRAFGRGIAEVGGSLLESLLRPLRALQSGQVGDYVAWFVLGMAAYAGLLVWLG